MCDTLTIIEKLCKKDVGGLIEVHLINPPDVLMLPKNGCSPLYTGEVLMKPGAVMYRIHFNKNTGLFSEKSIESRNGDYFDQGLSMIVSKDRDSVARLTQKLLNKRVHILLKYSDHTVKLMVNAKCGTEHSSGQRRSEQATTKFSFTAKNTKRALIIKQPVTGIVSAFSTGFFSTSFF